MNKIRTFARVLREVEKVRRANEKAMEDDLVKTITEAVSKSFKKTTEKPVVRSRYEVTQREAAEQLGVAVRTVKNWESGQPNPWGYTREKRRSKAEFGVFVATLQRDRATAENMMEGAGSLRLGKRTGMGVKKGMK